MQHDSKDDVNGKRKLSGNAEAQPTEKKNKKDDETNSLSIDTESQTTDYEGNTILQTSNLILDVGLEVKKTNKPEKIQGPYKNNKWLLLIDLDECFLAGNIEQAKTEYLHGRTEFSEDAPATIAQKIKINVDEKEIELLKKTLIELSEDFNIVFYSRMDHEFQPHVQAEIQKKLGMQSDEIFKQFYFVCFYATDKVEHALYARYYFNRELTDLRVVGIDDSISQLYAGSEAGLLLMHARVLLTQGHAINAVLNVENIRAVRKTAEAELQAYNASASMQNTTANDLLKMIATAEKDAREKAAMEADMKRQEAKKAAAEQSKFKLTHPPDVLPDAPSVPSGPAPGSTRKFGFGNKQKT